MYECTMCMHKLVVVRETPSLRHHLIDAKMLGYFALIIVWTCTLPSAQKQRQNQSLYVAIIVNH